MFAGVAPQSSYELPAMNVYGPCLYTAGVTGSNPVRLTTNLFSLK